MSRNYLLFGTRRRASAPLPCLRVIPSLVLPAGVDALYPVGGYDGAAPEPLINSLNSFSAFPSFA